VNEDGFLPFDVPVHGWLRFGGENTVVVRVDNERRTGEVPGMERGWRPYGGILREVLLMVCDPLRIQNVSLQAAPDGNRGIIDLAATIANDRPERAAAELAVDILDAKGAICASFRAAPASLDAGATEKVRLSGGVPGAHAWSPSSPQLYTARLRLRAGDEVADQEDVRFGFRTIAAKNGKLLLNGEPVFLTGFNRHEDSPRTGPCPDIDTVRQDLLETKESGSNFVRLCHYPHHPAELDLCDEIGLLVMEEIPLYWWNGSAEGAAESERKLAAARRQLERMIRRDAHHPCTIFWSVSNETKEKQSGTWNTVGAYKYDAQGRRIRKVVTNKGGLNGTTRFIWGGVSDWQCLEERDSNDALAARFTYSPGYIDAVAVQERDLNADSDFGDTNEVVYYHSNTLFSVYAFSDSSGSVIERYKYDAYGGCTVLDADGSVDADGLSDVGNPYLFTGRRLDPETGLMQYRNRYYSPALGRFVYRDPLADKSGLGLYVMVGGRPGFSMDPLGRQIHVLPVLPPHLPAKAPGGPMYSKSPNLVAPSQGIRPLAGSATAGLPVLGGGSREEQIECGWELCADAAAHLLTGVTPGRVLGWIDMALLLWQTQGAVEDFCRRIGREDYQYDFMHCTSNCVLTVLHPDLFLDLFSFGLLEECGDYLICVAFNDAGACYSAMQPDDYRANATGIALGLAPVLHPEIPYPHTFEDAFSYCSKSCISLGWTPWKGPSPPGPLWDKYHPDEPWDRLRRIGHPDYGIVHALSFF
jgi:RHS repeat-associated protein